MEDPLSGNKVGPGTNGGESWWRGEGGDFRDITNELEPVEGGVKVVVGEEEGKDENDVETEEAKENVEEEEDGENVDETAEGEDAGGGGAFTL